MESGSSTASLSARLAARAARQPDAIAVEDGDVRLTYAELDAAGGRIAAALVKAGAGPEEPVAVCLPRSWEAVCAMVGALRAGAAYVPVDPDYPPQRQRMLVELSGARLALTAASHGERLPEGVAQLEAGELARRENGDAAPGHPEGSDRLAYVLFTSGSTGTPKGVEVTHANLVNAVASGGPLRARAEDVALHVVPLGFDLSAQEIWGALLNGAHLLVAPRGRPDPAVLGQLIEDRGVTLLTISTGVFHELARGALARLGGLRLVSAGGDVMSPAIAAEFRDAHPSVRLFNSYGPTEATILAACFEVSEPDGGPVPIGRALPGYTLDVRDEAGVPVAAGEPGELWIGGGGVARGYRNDPERTARAFPTDPRGGRMYRTGDRVRLREDGELLFLGRLDHQVKIDGYRIEPGEVEHVLASHPGVGEAAVVVREDVPGHKRLVAYAGGGGNGARPTPDSVRRHLGERLPAFMVPRAVVILNSLPRNERGKVDRTALPAPTRRTGAGGTHPSPVADAMASVLGLDAVGPNENFFDLGGTSLLAIQLVGRLRQDLGANVGIGAVFAEPTPAGLAERIAAEAGTAPALPPLVPGELQSTAPVSAAQRRAWLFGKLRPDSTAYQYAAIFRFEGALDEEALRGALEDLLERHEILRTSFVERNGEPVQVIHGRAQIPLERVDLRGESSAAWAGVVQSRVRTQIDPGHAPLLRWTLARLGEESWALIHLEHHLVHDGWSFALLAADLAELYSARVEGREPRLQSLPVQFQDYARWERRAHESSAVRGQVQRWAERLDPAPPLIELPGARPRPAHESFEGGTVRRRIEPGLIRRLRELGGERGATLFMVTLAAFLAQLKRYSGLTDLQVGCGLANRRDPNAERVIGMIVNTVAFRCDLEGDPTVSELLERVRAVAIEAYQDADAPFDEVVEAIRPPRDPSRSPLVQALFSFHDAPRGSEDWSGLRVRLLQGVPDGTTKADLNVVGVPDADGGMSFVWEHSDLLDDADADRIAGHHLRLLEQFAATPHRQLSELDLVAADERPELERWRARAARHDRGATVHGLVAARAEERPEAAAVRDGGVELSYAELMARSRAVSALLAERGVARGDRVGVLLGRTADGIVAQLGVLGAGAAYVPLDPQHPAARIASVLADADVRLVLTDADLRGRLPAGAMACEVGAAAHREPVEAPAELGPDDLAYIIYTSGSTGEPNGVEVTHGNVVRLVDAPSYVDLGPGAVMLHAASPAFDASTLEVWGPLASGGTIACLREQPSADSVADGVAREGANTLWLTAGLFHEVVDRRLDCLGGVRHLLAGGDVLSPEHVRRALEALPPDARLSNGYGPTETTTFALTHEMRSGDPVPDPVPIGRPIGGTTCRVLDRAGREAPIGVPGELAIGGDGVARGYRGGAELTASRFVEDPERPGERMYLTGDRVRRRPDGALEFLGRLDRQVKIRGFRVEPAEVENALRAHARVLDAAVVPYDREAGDPALSAYFTQAPGSRTVTVAELRDHTARRLPTAMVPTAWIPMARLPLTANGKLDRAALPTPGNEHLVRESRSPRPASQAERRVARCFEEVLGVSDVGADDDFFALGGHSLLAVSLFAELERISGRKMSLGTIFEASTPRALAARLGGNEPDGEWPNLVPLKPTGSRPPIFVVAAGDGNIVGFGPLSRHLSAEQPMYALQPSGMDGRRPLDRGIETMAARYLEALRSVQPHGPYLLAGRCNGATVAYEMAQQLRAAGEEVPLLVALDSEPPPAGPRELLGEVPTDLTMEVALLRGREAGEEVPDLDGPRAGPRLAAWLRSPAGGRVSRYLMEVWRWREDLQQKWPDPLGADADPLAEFAWTHAWHELPPSLLRPYPTPACLAPDGTAWDVAIDTAWEQRGQLPDDPLSPPGWRSLRRDLLRPHGQGTVNGYLLAAWSRPDLESTFPDPAGADAEALREWAWRHGVAEGLAPELLPACPWPLSRRQRLEIRTRPFRRLAARAAAASSRNLLDLREDAGAGAVDALERVARRPLPGDYERLGRRVMAVAREARRSYQAQPWPGRVHLVTSIEYENKPPYLAWNARAKGGVVRRPLPLGHLEMLREPGAGLLAQCIEECVAEALGR